MRCPPGGGLHSCAVATGPTSTDGATSLIRVTLRQAGGGNQSNEARELTRPLRAALNATRRQPGCHATSGPPFSGGSAARVPYMSGVGRGRWDVAVVESGELAVTEHVDVFASQPASDPICGGIEPAVWRGLLRAAGRRSETEAISAGIVMTQPTARC